MGTVVESVTAECEVYDTERWGRQYEVASKLEGNEETPTDLIVAPSHDELKAKANAHFKENNFQQAFVAYSAALELQPFDPIVLNNRSLVLYRLGQFSQALADALHSVEILSADSSTSADEQRVATLAKAFFRQGTALDGLKRHEEALTSYREGLKTLPCESGLTLALRRTLPFVFGLSQLAAMWANQIVEAEVPAVMSTRDGKILKPIFPEEARLGRGALEGRLVEALTGREGEARDLLADRWRRGVEVTAGSSGRSLVSLMRAWAYLLEGRPEQALRDAMLAVAWSRTKHAPGGLARAHFIHARALEAAAAAPDADPRFANAIVAEAGEGGRKYALQASAVCAAAIAMRRAFEINPDLEDTHTHLKRMVRSMPSDQRKVLLEEGAEALCTQLEAEKWRNAPEYMRQRPKYFYYFEWMRERIGEHYPMLPAAVMDKMLAMDAGELDLLLQYPQAVKGQVDEYLDVFRSSGGKYLSTYRTPTLTWEEVKALKGAGTIGLGTGFDAPGEGHLQGERDTNHALVGGGGDGGLTATERLGLPAPSSLPPDQLRDRHNVHQATQELQQRLLLEGSAASGKAGALMGSPGGGEGAASAAPLGRGRQARILAAAESAVREAAEAQRDVLLAITDNVLAGTSDLDGID